MKSKALRVVAGLVVVVVILVVAAFALINPQKIVSEKKDEILKQVSAKIGRSVTAGNVTAHVGSELSARIESVRVARGKDGTDAAKLPAQLEIGAVDVRFSLGRALLSFGKDLTVERFTVSSLAIRAARDDAGVWDFQDVLDAVSSPSSAPATPASTSGAPDWMQGLRIASVKIENARVDLDDKMLGRPLAVSALNIDTSDVELGKPLGVHVTAVLEDGASKSPVDVDTKLAVLPKDLSFDPVPDVDVKLTATGVDLAPWGGLAPADSPAPVAGTVTAQITASAKDNLDKLVVDGTIGAKGLTLREAVAAGANKAERAAAPRGSPLDADLVVSLDVDQKKPHYAVKKLTLKGNGLDLDASVDASAASLAGLDKADVKASAPDLDRVLSVLPPSMRGLPEAVKIEGPLAVSLASNGAEINASVSFDGAHVRYLDLGDDDDPSTPAPKAATAAALFDKAAGKPLHLSLHGKRSAAALDVDNFALVLDTAKIGGTLSIPMGKDAALVADVNSGPVELASLQDMVPPFKDAIGKGQKVLGTAELRVKATSAGGKQQADASLALRSLDVNLASTVARGSGAFTLKAEPGADATHVVATADLDGLSVQKTGASGGLVVNKPAGLPLRLDVDAKKSATRADVAKLDLSIGKSAIHGHGSVTALDKDEPQLDVDLGDVALAFDDLRAAVPGAAKLPPGGHINGKVKLAGGASAKNISVDLKALDLLMGKTDIKGDISVKSLAKPQFTLSLNADYLDVDALRGALGSSDDKTPKKPVKEAKDDNPHGLGKDTRAMLKDTNGKGTITAKKALVKGIPLENFKGVLVVTKGVARFDALDFGMYSGTVSAAGSIIDLEAERTGYDLKLKGKDVDFGDAVAAQTSLGKIFTGKLSPDVDIKGKGLGAGDFAITADGPAALSFKSLSLTSLDLLGSIGDAVTKSGKVPGAKATSSKGLAMEGFKAATQFNAGKVKLEKPVETDTPIGKIVWTGFAGLDAGLDLAATVNLTPAEIAKMTGGKLKVKDAVPVPVKIGGTWDKPKVTGVDVGKLLAALIGGAAGTVASDVEKDLKKGDAKDAAKDALDALTGKDTKKDPKKKDPKKSAADAATDAAKALLGGGKKK